jgi:O-methyltransferase involved in polyketide biosynthesis
MKSGGEYRQRLLSEIDAAWRTTREAIPDDVRDQYALDTVLEQVRHEARGKGQSCLF